MSWWVGTSLFPRPTYTGEIKDIDTDFLHLLDSYWMVDER